MERNANYALVGAAALLLIAAAVAFLAFLAGREEAYRDYDAYLPAPVQGLQTGAVVYFNGVQVGSVTQIQLLPQFSDRVRVRMRVGLSEDGAPSPIPPTTGGPGTPVFRATVQLEPQLVTGVSSIQASPRLPGARPPQECQFERQNFARLQALSGRTGGGLGGGSPVEILCSTASPLSGLLGSANGIAAQAQEALQRVNTLLTDENFRSLSATLGNVETITGDLAARRQLFAEVERTVVALNATARQFEQLAASSRPLVERDAPATLAEIRRTAAEAGRTAEEASRVAADARRVVNQLEGTANQVNANVLPQLTETLESAQAAAEQLERVASEVQENPRALLRRGPAEEREIPQ